MQKKEWYYPSSDQKTMIYAVEYQPPESQPVKGLVQIVVGCSENVRIYEALAAALANRGFIVRANDHIGHGRSASSDQPRNYFGEKGSWKYALKDIHALRRANLTSENRKQLPYILVGHSLGAFLVREYLYRYKDVDGAVISGSGLQPALALKFIRKMMDFEVRVHGYDSDSDFVQAIMHGTNNRKIKNAVGMYDWLLKDPEGKKLFEGDDIGGRITAGIFLELTKSMLYSQNEENLKKMKKDIPLFFMAGQEDVSVACGKDVEKAVALYHKCGMKNIKYKLYANGRHCIFQDYCKEEVTNDLLAWLDELVQERDMPEARD